MLFFFFFFLFLSATMVIADPSNIVPPAFKLWRLPSKIRTIFQSFIYIYIFSKKEKKKKKILRILFSCRTPYVASLLMESNLHTGPFKLPCFTWTWVVVGRYCCPCIQGLYALRPFKLPYLGNFFFFFFFFFGQRPYLGNWINRMHKFSI